MTTRPTAPAPPSSRRRAPTADARARLDASRRQPELAPFYAQELDWEPCRGRVRVRHADGARSTTATRAATPSSSRCSRTRPTTRRTGSARSWSTRAARARPAPTTPQHGRAAFGDPLRDALRHRRLRPARHRRAPTRSTASPTTSSTHYVAADPDPDDAAEAAEFVQTVERVRRRLRRRTPATWPPTSPPIEAARDMDVLRAALGEATLDYFGASYGTKLGATYAELFPDKVGRLVLDGAVDLSLDARGSSASSRPAASRPRCGPTSQNCVDDGDCFLGDTVDEGLAPDPATSSTTSTSSRCPTGDDRELTDRQRLLRHRRAALQPRLLVDPRPGAAAGASTATARSCCGSPTSTRSRDDDGTYTDNSARGDPRDQLPRRPVARSRRRRCRRTSRDFEKASPTFGDVLRLGADRLPRRSRPESTEQPLDDPRPRAPRRSW